MDETGLNTTENIFPGFPHYYNRNLLRAAVPKMIHGMFAQVKDIPANNTLLQKFRTYALLTPNTTEITEGITPSGKKLLPTDQYIEVKQYGDYVEYTDVVTFSEPDPFLTETGKQLGVQAGRSLDWIMRDIYNAGTSVMYGGNATSRDTVDSSDVCDEAGFRLAHLQLRLNLADYITDLTMSSPDTATKALMPSYFAYVHPRTTHKLKVADTLTQPSEYADKTMIMPHEVGQVDQVRLIESTEAKVFEGAGSGGIDVYSTLIFGQNAMARSSINGQSLQNIIKPLGSGNDPLNQRGTTGWKATLGAGLLFPLYLIRYEHAV